MKKLKLVSLAIAMACATPSLAGGLLTNTNQHVAFNRMMSREASIGIDGVYYNPAGVVFMGEGKHHLLSLLSSMLIIKADGHSRQVSPSLVAVESVLSTMDWALSRRL